MFVTLTERVNECENPGSKIAEYGRYCQGDDKQKKPPGLTCEFQNKINMFRNIDITDEKQPIKGCSVTLYEKMEGRTEEKRLLVFETRSYR